MSEIEQSFGGATVLQALRGVTALHLQCCNAVLRGASVQQAASKLDVLRLQACHAMCTWSWGHLSLVMYMETSSPPLPLSQPEEGK